MKFGIQIMDLEQKSNETKLMARTSVPLRRDIYSNETNNIHHFDQSLPIFSPIFQKQSSNVSSKRPSIVSQSKTPNPFKQSVKLKVNESERYQTEVKKLYSGMGFGELALKSSKARQASI